MPVPVTLSAQNQNSSQMRQSTLLERKMTFLEDRDISALPSIKEYYKGKTIFITGGSGFMGKVLIEKLLYSCTDLERIYLLLRTKRGVRPEERLAALYRSPCYDRLRTEKPGVFESKLFLISGDINEDGLGISDEDRALLINNVNIIFHVAASVRFDDTLNHAAKLNLRGTKIMVDLAQEMRHIESFMHVSTSYSNTNKECIDEVLYPPHADWRETLNICETLDSRDLEILTPKYIGKLPNTYVFTKQLAEHVVSEQRGKLPVVIIRPSVVISSFEEPIPGWNENFNGPIGLIIAIAKGLLRTVYGKGHLITDYIPVDTAIKHFIAVSWIRGTKKLEATEDVAIYNCCAGNLKPVTMKKIGQIGYEILNEIPLNDNMWGCSYNITSSRFIYYLRVLFEHLLPAVLIDTLLKILGRKPRLVKIQRRIYTVQIALQDFTMQQWTFLNKNFVKLRSIIKNCDSNDFYYKMETIDEVPFMIKSTIGARRYILNETDEELPKAKEQFRRMKFMQTTTNYIFYALVIWWMWNFIQSYFAEYLQEIL